MPGFYYWPDYPNSMRLARVRQLPPEERCRCEHKCGDEKNGKIVTTYNVKAPR